MKYSYEFKLKAVKYYLKTGSYIKTNIESKRKTFVDKIRRWVKLYKLHGAQILKHDKSKQFSIKQKLKIIKEFNKGRTYTELSLELGIEKAVVMSWVKKYNLYGEEGLKSRRGFHGKSKKTLKKIKKEKTLLEKIRHIEDLKDRSNKTLKSYLKEYRIPKSTYHYNLKRKTYREKNEYLYFVVKKIFESSNNTYGINRIKIALANEYGLVINKKKILRIMRDQNLKVKLQKGKYKSYKGKRGVICDNLIHRNFKADRPLQKITTDVTEFNLPFGKVYLQTYLDMYNDEILCYQISDNITFIQTRRLFEKLVKKYKDKLKFTIFHSDQGWQYQTEWYQNQIKELDCFQSMSRKGNCLDNSVMENFFGRLKMEMFYGNEYKFKNYRHFKLSLEKYIYFYNNIRIKTKYKTSPIFYRNRFVQQCKI